MADFKSMTLEEKMAFAQLQIDYWRAIQRTLYRRNDAITPEEKAAIDVKISADAEKIPVDVVTAGEAIVEKP